MVRTAPTALLDAGEWGENDETTSLHTVRALLELYLEMSLLAPEAQAAALAAMRSEDERQLFKFALSDPGTDDFVELVDGVESRAAEAAPEPPALSADEFAQFYAAFDAVPAQLHHAKPARDRRGRTAPSRSCQRTSTWGQETSPRVVTWEIAARALVYRSPNGQNSKS